MTAPTTQTLTPYLTVSDAAAALAWYVDALGAVERTRWTDDAGRIGHSELAIGDARVYVADEWPDGRAVGPQRLGGSPVLLHLDVVDADHAYARAVEHGAQGVRPPEDAHGDRVATVVDPFGHRWMFSQPLEGSGGDRDRIGDWNISDRPPVELGYLVLGPASLDPAVAFYGGLFDWRIERGGAGGGHVANTRFPLGISPQGDGSVTPYFRVDDLDLYIARVERLGGRVHSRATFDSGQDAECEDDQGMPFHLWRPAAGY